LTVTFHLLPANRRASFRPLPTARIFGPIEPTEVVRKRHQNLRNPLRRSNHLSRVETSRPARHAVHNRDLRVLADGDAASLADEPKLAGAVAPHAGEQDSHGVRSEGVGDRTEEVGDRRPVAVLGIVEGERNGSVAVDAQLVSVRADQDTSGQQPFAVTRFRDLEGTPLAQPLHEARREALRDVLHDHNGGGEVAWQPAQDGLERRRPPAGGADRDDAHRTRPRFGPPAGSRSGTTGPARHHPDPGHQLDDFERLPSCRRMVRIIPAGRPRHDRQGAGLEGAEGSPDRQHPAGNVDDPDDDLRRFGQ
jgi:hypothetical protein